MIRFDAKTQIIISDNLREDVGQLVDEEQASHVAAIIDSAVAENSEITDLFDHQKKKTKLEIYAIQSIEPTTELVNQYTKMLRDKGIDLLIGIGGGSVMDLAKALSVMLVHEGPVEDYHGTGKPFARSVRKILIPTTAGTGSEVTPGAVLVNTKTNFKRGIGGRWISADYAVLNAKLTLSMPAHITAATGLDALAHAIESYTARNATEITRMYSAKAFSLVYNNLGKIFDDPQNLELRKKILLGSCLAGFAIYNSNTGACHALSYPLGIYHHVPHGVAVGHLIAKIVAINVKKGCDLYGDLHDLIDGTHTIAEDQTGNKKRMTKAVRFSQILSKHRAFLYLNKTFADYGITPEHIDFLAERGLDLAPALNNNPVEFTLEDAKAALAATLHRE